MKTKMTLFFLILGLMAVTGCGQDTIFGPDQLGDLPVGDTGLDEGDGGGDTGDVGDDVADELDPIPDLGGFIKPPGEELHRP